MSYPEFGDNDIQINEDDNNTHTYNNNNNNKFNNDDYDFMNTNENKNEEFPINDIPTTTSVNYGNFGNNNDWNSPMDPEE